MPAAAIPARHPVVLIGAGPGDPELLTLKAARRIGEADVLLVDDLVDPAVLAHARPGVRVRHVGKRGGLRSTPQSFIDRLMVREALAGRRVVRLKGGDPMVFGRAGEEIAALREAGLEVEIVNGVSSALAAAASLQMSLTHRAHAQGVVFVTGHPKPGGADADWAMLARAGFTLAIYMGVSKAVAIVQALRDGGLPADLPAAAVHAAGRADERRLVTTLGALVEDLAAQRIGSPAILIVGKVAAEAVATGVAVAPDPTIGAASCSDAFHGNGQITVTALTSGC